MDGQRLSFDQQALLCEDLSDEEVSTLLRRLTADEFQETRLTTIGDIVEAIHADPTVVAALLAEIRDPGSTRVEAKLAEHETRLERLETRAPLVQVTHAKSEARAAVPRASPAIPAATESARAKRLRQISEHRPQPGLYREGSDKITLAILFWMLVALGIVLWLSSAGSVAPVN